MDIKKNSDLGEIFVTSHVIAEMAGAVAGKCYGVVGMAARNKKDGIVNLLKQDNITKGISISVEEDGIVAQLHIVVEYGVNIHTVCKSIVNRVRYTLENYVGVPVKRVDVRVEGVRVDE